MPNIFKSMPPVTKNIIIICAIIQLATYFVSSLGPTVNRFCGLHYLTATDFNGVQLVTYMFLHGGFIHLLFNMLTLFMFGTILEYTLGSRRFLLFYLTCGVGAALIQEGVWALTLPDTIINGLAQVNHVTRTQIEQYIAMNPGVMTDNLNYFTTVGASGSIYGVLLAFGMLYPNRPLYFMFIPVPVKAKYMVIIWILLERLLGVGAQADGIAHFAHLGGMIFGFLMIWYWMKKGIVHRENF